MARIPCFALALLLARAASADQVVMQNGDRFSGQVISMTADVVVFKSDTLGKVTLPRAKISGLIVGTAAVPAPANSIVMSGPVTNTAPGPAPSIIISNSNPDIAGALRSLGANTNFIGQVRSKFLADAGSEATGKFDDMVNGLATGKLDLAGLRAQAKSAAGQLRALQGQSAEADDSLGVYLTILDNFLRETASASTTNAP